MAELAAGTFVQLATEALLYQVVQAVAQGHQLDLVDYLVDESQLQQGAGLLFGNAALTHVEESRVVELTYR